jgi:hypothetical protein
VIRDSQDNKAQPVNPEIKAVPASRAGKVKTRHAL